MTTLQQLIHFLIHIDTYLINFVAIYGLWAYVILFAIIFCETGLVIFPFLPGDSLIFAAGSLAAHQSEPLNFHMLFVSLTLASILGNKINYLIGMYLGPRVFGKTGARFLNQQYLLRAHEFYNRHGGKTIIFARFLPILRTFVPFVAGIAYMSLPRFSVYNVMSALVWIGSLLSAGYFLGGLPFFQKNFSLVVYGIIFVSLLPPIALYCSKIYSSNL